MQTIPVLNLFFLLGRTANEERWTSRCLMGTQSQVFLFLLSFSRPLFRDPRTEFSYFAASWNGCLLASLGLLSFFFFSSKKTKKHKEFFKKDKNWSSFFLWRILFVLLRCSPCRHRLFRRREWEVEKDKNDDKINHSFDESLGRFWERKRKHIYTNCKKKQNETTNWTRTALVL